MTEPAQPAPPPPPDGRPALVVCLEEEIFSPVSYIRVVRHLQELRDTYAISLFVLPGELDAALTRLPGAALLLLARNRHESSCRVARAAAAAGVPILFDLDDYVWEFPDYSRVVRHDRVHTDEMLALASCITTPAPPLAEAIRARLPAARVQLVPNAGDIWSGSGRTFTPAVMANSDFFRMPELRVDFFRAVHDAAREADRPLLLYYFANDPPEPFSDAPHLRIAWMGLRAYSSYRQLLDHLRPELAFVLLRDEPFSRCKSVVKFAEFGAAGAIGVYSRVAPYAGAIGDGVTGFLADNTYAGWREAVGRALRQTGAARHAMQARIAAEVGASFSFAPIHATFRGLLAAHARPAPPAPPGAENLPPLAEFTFKEAYAHTSWLANVEMPWLRHELSVARHRRGDWLRARLAAFAHRLLHPSPRPPS